MKFILLLIPVLAIIGIEYTVNHQHLASLQPSGADMAAQVQNAFPVAPNNPNVDTPTSAPTADNGSIIPNTAPAQNPALGTAAVPSPTTPDTTGMCTNYFTSSTAVPAGYGAAYNVFSSAKEPTVQAGCFGDTPIVSAGSGASDQYVYRQGYVYKGGTWRTISYAGPKALYAGNWYPGQATAKLLLNASDLSDWNYITAYICTWSGTAWHCGCADSACTEHMWQLQAIKR